MQGQTGPNALYPGFGQLMAALSGFYHISGYGDGEPSPPYGAYSDFVAPRFLAAAVIAALDYKRRTGKGQYIDMSQYEAALQNLAPALIDYFATGRILAAQANQSPRYAPHGAYRCADQDGIERWISIAVENDADWKALLAVIGSDGFGDRYARHSQRLGDQPGLDQLINAKTRAHQAWDLTHKLQAAGVAAYPVQNCVDLHQDENLEAFEFWHWLDHQEMGPSPYEGLQHRLSKTPGELRRPAPALGQHNQEIFGGMLGMDQAEVDRLIEAKVIF
jgi:benzylsuccinate CoA-transferase BbsF subunit